jgi:hypothetical protein
MITITKDSEIRLIEMLNSVRYESSTHFAIHFHLSKLGKDSHSDYQMKIVINVINDFFKLYEGGIFLCNDRDAILIYKGDNKNLIDKIIFQVRYLFTEEKIAFSDIGVENPDFCYVYILNYQWQEFYNIAEFKLNNIKIPTIDDANKKEVKKTSANISASFIARVEKDLETIDLSRIIRTQSICAILSGRSDIKPVFHELYVSISHLKNYLKYDVNLLSNKKLFLYFTEKLDLAMLKLLKPKLGMQPSTTISLNLNVSTLLSKEFADFDHFVKKAHKIAIVIEIEVADIFSDIMAFNTATKYVQQLGYRVCLDGLTHQSFIHVDRESLGFDLVKLQWNADSVNALRNGDNKKLFESIKKCGANRVILSRCDNIEAISYGHALGISLFQGWYIDKLTNNEPKIIL